MNSKVNSILFFLILVIPQTVISAWTPIVGIPEPTFGIDEIAPSSPSPWTAEIPGFYYVCPSCPQSTDTSNTYGFPSKPRITIPNIIPAGSVVELRGQHSLAITKKVESKGTFEAPVFIRGDVNDKPILAFKMYFLSGSSYTIVENIISAPDNTMQYPKAGMVVYEGADHIVIRNSDFSGNSSTAGGIFVGGSGDKSISASNVVIDNVYIHDRGDLYSQNDMDTHCVTVNGTADHVWLVNSELARCSGDGIQINAGIGRNDSIHHIYVGNNKAHGNRQCGVWSKQATDVIFSTNDIYDHAKLSTSSMGQAAGFQYGPEYVWFINNKIHDNWVGIIYGGNSGGVGTESFIVGNLIYDNYNPEDPLNPHGSGAIILRGGMNQYVVNNTISGFDSGINNMTNSGNLVIENNIFSNKKLPGSYDIYVEFQKTDPAQSSLGSNIFNNGENEVVTKWMNQSYSTLATLQSAFPNEITGNTIADPLFVSESTKYFHLSAASPAIGVAGKSKVFAIFQARYGIDISKDINGGSSPSGVRSDIGAYEFTNQSGLSIPREFQIIQK